MGLKEGLGLGLVVVVAAAAVGWGAWRGSRNSADLTGVPLCFLLCMQSCFEYALQKKWPLYLSTKNTILKAYDGKYVLHLALITVYSFI
jgi:hypothetical protein